MMKLGILGAGRIGAVHARNAAANPRIALVALSDVISAAAEALSKETGAPAWPMEAVLEDPSIDAVLLATPTDTHADLCERAAAAGKAVFCEKPVDLDAARVRACLARVEAANVAFFVGFNRRFDPSFARFKRRLDDGEIGGIEVLSITSRDPSPPPIAYIERSGGLFRDMMIHDLDMACWLLGETPSRVHAAAAVLVDPAIGAAGDVDTAVVTLAFRSGRLCQISNSRRATYGYDQRIEAHGSLGMLLADNRHDTTVSRADAAGFTRDPAQHFFLERYAEAYRAELDAFARCVIDGRDPSPNGDDGLRALILADAANESARTGRTVEIEAE
jgi:myo-inositol 2-dehydrogenase / D-chiro-inositol 1-dehydrogenase